MLSGKAVIAQCLKRNKYMIFLWHRVKMLNLSLQELRLIARNINTNGYQSMPTDKLLRIANNKKGDRKSLFISKERRNQKKSGYKPTGNGLYKSTKKYLFRSKKEEIKEILYDSIINRDEKIKEI